MNEQPIDPALESLAARLAAQSPRLSAGEAQELLYQCAFAAGQSSAAARTRRWQGLSVVLAVLLVAAGLPLAAGRLPLAIRQPPAAPPSQPAPAPADSPPQRAIAGAAAVPGKIEVDAWQNSTDSSQALEQGLSRFEQIEPEFRSLAVVNLSRGVLAQQ
jgi:hypothetical protein